MRISENNKYRNFVTGEALDTIKVKPEQGMINTCKIQLFDGETHQIKEEVVSENVINNHFSKLFTKILGLYHTFTWYPVATTFSNRDFFGSIVLTDYTGPEDPDISCIKGNVIGWAGKYRTYAGADPLRGSVNVMESGMVNENIVRYVFDFHTPVSNGTIGTVWWVPSDHLDSTTEMRQPLVGFTWFYDSSTLLNPPSSSDGPMTIVGDKLYHTKSGRVYSTLSNLHGKLVRNSETTTEEADLSTIDTTLRGIQWDPDNENFWVIGDQFDKAYKFDKFFTLVSSYPFPISTYLGATYYDYVIFKGFLFAVKYKNATTIELYKFSLDDMSLVSTYNILVPGGNYANWGVKSDTVRISKDDDYLMIYNAATGSGVRSYSAAVLEVTEDGVISGDYGIWWGETVSSNLAFNPRYKYWESPTRIYNIRSTPSSQTLLPLPITKTGLDYMKLIFEFDISALSF